MKWSNEKPTVPGWYWHRPSSDCKYRDLAPFILEVVKTKYDGELGFVDGEVVRRFPDFGQWAGPIREPEE